MLLLWQLLPLDDRPRRTSDKDSWAPIDLRISKQEKGQAGQAIWFSQNKWRMVTLFLYIISHTLFGVFFFFFLWWVSVCMRVRACVRARVRVCVRVCTGGHLLSLWDYTLRMWHCTDCLMQLGIDITDWRGKKDAMQCRKSSLVLWLQSQQSQPSCWTCHKLSQCRFARGHKWQPWSILDYIESRLGLLVWWNRIAHDMLLSDGRQVAEDRIVFRQVCEHPQFATWLRDGKRPHSHLLLRLAAFAFSVTSFWLWFLWLPFFVGFAVFAMLLHSNVLKAFSFYIATMHHNKTVQVEVAHVGHGTQVPMDAIIVRVLLCCQVFDPKQGLNCLSTTWCSHASVRQEPERCWTRFNKSISDLAKKHLTSYNCNIL